MNLNNSLARLYSGNYRTNEKKLFISILNKKN